MPQPQIIFLNGVSSSGKTTVAKALQKQLDRPFLHVCIDAFEEMSPGRARKKKERSHGRQVFNRMLSGFHHSLAAMASRDNNLIVDHLLIEETEPLNWVRECLQLLTPFDVFLVGLHCPLEELERRESARGDRPIGLAEWQHTRIHRSVEYDLALDTSLLSPKECALEIIDAQQHLPHRALESTLRSIYSSAP